ncbi:angiotensin-converting enzyme-like [Argopecten irradians]|uniref:angiotensin-converting enzyme-like n=1 Tax=Argopecten irradians TaxID=31199 RepID=UPI00371C1DB3
MASGNVLEALWEQVKPLYQELHGYVRKRLRSLYGAERFPASGHIPAHVLGDMMGDNWENLFDVLKPFDNRKNADISQSLKEKNYTTEKMLRKAEEFFVSIGMPHLPSSFWEKSTLTLSSDNCNDSPTFVILGSNDIRLHECAEINHDNFVTVHEELARIHYSWVYQRQPFTLQGPANPGFEEAVAGLMRLSVSTPKHLHRIDLLEAAENNTEDSLNFIMKIGLHNIPSLTFGHLISLWQASAFNGETPQNKYNDKWWKLRNKYQGLSPPDDGLREGVFYPRTGGLGSISMPYIRYFLGTVLAFQLHEGLCMAAGHDGPLHECDLYQSRQAGALLTQMLESGRSIPWQDILEQVSGQRHIDASSLIKYFQPLYDWLTEQNMGESFGWNEDYSAQTINEKANALVNSFNQKAEDVYRKEALARWNYVVNMSSESQMIQINTILSTSEFAKTVAGEVASIPWRELKDSYIRRQLKSMTDIGLYAMKNSAKLKRLYTLKSRIQNTYKKAKVCVAKGRCLSLNPGLTDIMATSRNKTVLLKAWKGWREATVNVKPYYNEFIDLSNEAIRDLGYPDTGEYWNARYETPQFESEIDNLFTQLMPFYESLHAYIRKRLIKMYGSADFPITGHIPAHLLGDMWGGSWGHIYDLVKPYNGSKSVNITRELQRQKFTVKGMFKSSEEFFISLGLSPLPKSFWNNSLFVKLTGQDADCQTSSWYMFNGSDVRMKMCGTYTVDEKNLLTIHQQLARIQYFLQYRNQPIAFQREANPGFDEAVGNVITLSVSTSSHLQDIGLFYTSEAQSDTKADINFLMKVALDRIAFVPFSYFMSQWWSSVFKGEISPDHYNEKWWQLRCKYQGVYPPVERTQNNFDPGTMYRANNDFNRFVVSSVIQFQFHKALCDAAGHTGPLHTCDIYKSKEAGKLLGDMLELGSSVPWPEAMEAITGQRSMDVGPLLEYFRPLNDWLQNENYHERPGWSDACPTVRKKQVKRPTSDISGTSRKNISFLFLLYIVILCQFLLV